MCRHGTERTSLLPHATQVEVASAKIVITLQTTVDVAYNHSDTGLSGLTPNAGVGTTVRPIRIAAGG